MSEPSNKTPTSFIGSPPPPTPPKYSIMAVISLSLSCLSFVIGPIGYIPGIIFGHAARSECKKNPQLAGSRVALAGLVIGYLCLFLTITVLVLILNYFKFAFKSFVVTDPDALQRMLEELQRFLSSTATA